MAIIQCDELSDPKSPHPDAVWVQKDDVLFYYNVDSCLTVTLVCKNGLVGGHVGMVSPERVMQPAQNLKDVIGKMIKAAPKTETGDLEEIYWIGNIDDVQWSMDEAVELIWSAYGGKDQIHGQSKDRSPIDVVFNTAERTFHIAKHTDGQTAEDVQKKDTQGKY